MANPRALVKRRKSVQNTRKITKTMEMVSTARMAKAQVAAVAARPYAHKLREVIGDLAGLSGGIQHPLLVEHPMPRKAVLIVMTSDRGLCAAFNSNVIRAAREFYRELKARGLDIELIVHGKKAQAALKYSNLAVAKTYLRVSDKPNYGRAEEIGQDLIDRYTKGEIDEAYVAYSVFKNLTSQVPKVEKLLPLAGLEGSGDAGVSKKRAGAGYLFHPGPEKILSEMLPLVVKLSIFTAMLDSNAGEHSARRVAMKNATDAADDMIKSLTQRYNRARQGKITQEISEIVSGAEAL
jgi:F-type H+-transporting ATPase subunit gamma